MLVDGIVHFPEPTLRAGRLGCFRRELGLRMDSGNRKVSEHELELVAEALLKLLDDRIGVAAMRALVVAIFEQRYPRGVPPWT
jgi:hypothetical protein